MLKSVVNYHPKPCASERTRSPCRFASLFHFSAKQCVLDAHLRVRENPAGWLVGLVVKENRVGGKMFWSIRGRVGGMLSGEA